MKDIFRELGGKIYEKVLETQSVLLLRCGMCQLVLRHQCLADGSSKLVFVLRHLNVSVSATAPLAIFLSPLLYYYIHKHKDGRRVWY
jgi:hypothetical protein